MRILWFFCILRRKHSSLYSESRLLMKSTYCSTNPFSLSAFSFVFPTCPWDIHNLIYALVLWLELLYNIVCICNSCIISVSVICWEKSRGQRAPEIKLFCGILKKCQAWEALPRDFWASMISLTSQPLLTLLTLLTLNCFFFKKRIFNSHCKSDT